MERVVGDMNLLQCLVYLDDLIVFGRTLEEHEERLFKVLDRLEECGLKVSIDKCQFCQAQVKYVGHIVSSAGIATDPDKVKAVSHWPRPTNLKLLQAFLGFCGYYRRFIANYSAIIHPLTDLTRGYPPTQKRKVSEKGKVYLKKSEPFDERWTPECTEAFEKIKYCLTHAPVLAFADPNKPYILHVDTSFEGLVNNLSEPVSSQELRVAQRNDPVISNVRQAVLKGAWPSGSEVDPNFLLFRREEKKLTIVNGLLYRKTSKAGDEPVFKLVLPEQYREEVLKSLHDESATRKKTTTAAAGGGPPVAAFTPAEELALEQNSRRPIIVGIEGGITSDPVCPHDAQPYVKDITVVGDVLTLLDPPVFDSDGEIAGPSRVVQEDEDTVSACSERPAEMEEPREGPQASTSRAQSSAREQESEIREIYKRYLLQDIQCKKADLQYKKLKIRKLELEIKKMEKDAVSHPSTNQARPCLASEIRRDRALSEWYGRKRERSRG
ncbi:hypothetical protein MHYP_G00329700 [Metynnis hypsauchen]